MTSKVAKTTKRKTPASVRRARRRASTPHSLTGEFRMHRAFHSTVLPHDRDVIVYLPPGYSDDPFRRYPVFYMHDGQNLFDGRTSFIPGVEWEVDESADRLIRAGKIEPLIIVGIYNTGRHRIEEYTPTRDGRVGHGGQARLYGRLLVEELMPFVNSEYRTLEGPAHTGLGGSSLGGLVTLYLGLKYPHVFGKLAVMSPSLWWDHRILVRSVEALGWKPPARIWLDIGLREGVGAVVPVRTMCHALLEKGFQLGDDLGYLEAKGARHGERAWAKRVKPMLKFLFGKGQYHSR